MFSVKILKNHAIHLRDFLLDTVFPIECLGCQRDGEWICSSCFNTLTYNNRQYCHYCNKISIFGQTCQKCKSKGYLDGLLAAGDYQKPLIARIIKSYKYYGAKNLDNIINNYLITFIKEQHVNNGAKDIFDSAELVPVPLHPRRLRWRGFNQAEEIACHLAKNLDLEILNVLERIKYSKAQAKIALKKRHQNIKNSFVCRGNVENKNIILIDDITTTGSTLEECARILKQNKARTVWGLVVARG